MAAQYLFENSDRPQIRRPFQHGHDLRIPNLGNRTSLPSAMNSDAAGRLRLGVGNGHAFSFAPRVFHC